MERTPKLILFIVAVAAVAGLVILYSLNGFGPKDRAEEPAPSATMRLEVFFSNAKLDPPGTYDCSLVYPVSRTVSKDPNITRAALMELLKGPTPEEQAQGYTSFFSDATRDILQSVRADQGVAYVDFKDFRSVIPNASSSCGSAQFFAQVETTLKQFPGIGRVIYAIDKIPQTFYDFMQIGCDWKSTTCDGANFP